MINPASLFAAVDRAMFRLLRGTALAERYFWLNRIAFARLLPEQRFWVDVPDCGWMWLDKVDVVNLFLYYFGGWEPAITRIVRQSLKPGDSFLDVGANVGYYTLLAARLVGETGRVIAVDASPSVFGILSANVARNRCANVELHNGAIADGAARRRIYRGDRFNVGNTAVFDGADRSYEGEVDAVTIDELLDGRDLSGLACIKIDVEGAELQVVRGMPRTLRRLPRGCRIFLEASAGSLRAQGADIQALLEPFVAGGFRVLRIDNRYDFAFYDTFRAQPPSLVDAKSLEAERLVDLLLSRSDVVAN